MRNRRKSQRFKTVEQGDDYKKMYSDERLREALVKFFKDIASDDKNIFSLDVTYTVQKERERAAGSINRNFTRLHRRILRYLAGSRNYDRDWFRDIEPIFLCFVDEPGWKRKHQKKELTPSSRDSTLHHHIIIAVSREHTEKFQALVSSKDPISLFQSSRADLSGIREFRFGNVALEDESLRKKIGYVSAWSLHHQASPTGDETFFILPERSHRRYDEPETRLNQQ